MALGPRFLLTLQPELGERHASATCTGDGFAALPEGKLMRPCIVAALLAFAMLGPGSAVAFELDTGGGTKPDGSPRYVDPDDKPLPAPLGGVAITPGVQFGGSATGTGSPAPSSSDDPGGANPLPGRLTR